MPTIDLRSDTVTRPSEPMRLAMSRADVGDDQYGEDPTVNALQDRVSQLLGKEAALFVPSGTMANQIALKLLTRPGEEVIVADESHVVWHEAGAAAANAGVQFAVVGRGGLFDAEDVARAFKPRDHMIFPATALVVVENTHNRSGGIVFPLERAKAISRMARELALKLYCDGARLFNAAAATGQSLASLASPYDLVSVALSKGLGCPVGSVMAGSRDDIVRAVRYRRMFGGALRQAGILAAAGLYALDHNLERLAEDHAKARLFANAVVGLKGIRLDLDSVQTNIVIFHLDESVPDAATIVAQARQEGLLLSLFGPRTVRATTHLDVGHNDCVRGAEILSKLSKSW